MKIKIPALKITLPPLVSRWLKRLTRIRWWQWALGLLGVVILVGATTFAVIALSLPDLSLLQNRQVAESTKIYDRTGEVLLYEIYGEEKRTIVPFAEIPEQLKQATLVIEDENFYRHGAFDVKSLLRAALVDLKSGRVVQGGSTITQQLVKKAFLSDERTLARKIKELVLAIELEKNLTKDEILNLYLNQIPYGSNAYGVEAAAKTYFQKSVADLTLAEIALLVSLPRAPSFYSPYGSHVDDLLGRKSLVLKKMQAAGFITEAEQSAADKEKLSFTKQTTAMSAPHFIIAVQEYLNEKYGEDFIRGAGLKVITTLDAELQTLAEAAVTAGAKRNEELYKGKNAALVAQDAKTGQILALVGSRDYFNEEIDGNFNVATQGLRQPGSAIKPFSYLTAFKKGYTPDTVLFDLETEFDSTGDPANSYKPGNYDETFRGPITMRAALAQSINIPAVKTLYLAGIDDMLKLIKSFGVTTLTERSRYGLSLTLGGGEVKLIDLVEAYSVLAQDGVKHDQNMILKIEDRNKEVLEQYQDFSVRVIDPQYPRLINDILSDGEARAPLFHASYDQTVFPGYDVAIKTGTTNDYRDAWAVGYSPSLVAGVWAGNSDNAPMERRGGSILAAIPILHTFLADALKSQPQEAFTRPEPVLATKPILRGEYLINYQAGGISYPQIHDILFYVNKKNPLGPEPAQPDQDAQFKNWEGPVLAWASANIPGFSEGVNFNQPLPVGAIISAGSTSSSQSITINSPVAGSYIQNTFQVSAVIAMPNGISRVEVYFNDAQISSTIEPLTPNLNYQNVFSVNNLGLQNNLRLVAIDAKGNSATKEVIVYH